MKARVYVVSTEDKPARLVRATYAHMAERHVISTLVHARVASKDDLIHLMGAGVRVETATDEPDPASAAAAESAFVR